MKSKQKGDNFQPAACLRILNKPTCLNELKGHKKETPTPRLRREHFRIVLSELTHCHNSCLRLAAEFVVTSHDLVTSLF